ncbi:hypothetical protein [Longitalea arenae]|uniref:hypothetical protein n=1 Tax=Longitalea arenae TaxID=2812558 RepID=UPI001967C99A|nr:hypothetical protein [Longitalea arenae]
MKSKNTLLRIPGYAALIAFAGLSGCDKNDHGGGPQQKDANVYAIALVAGTGSAQTTYIQGLAGFDTASLGNGNATELAGNGRLITYNGAAYVSVYNSPATMTKYTFDQSGKAVKTGELVVPGAKTYSTVAFVSPTEAYASVAGGLAKLIKFNPTTMERSGEIDLAAILRPEAPVMYYLGMKARDGKLFMGVFYEGAGFVEKYNDTAYVAVIDLATARLEKLIKDHRTGSVFDAYNAFSMDKNGDIYVAGLGYTNRPSGILRIKKGATDFDPTWFLDLDAATGYKCRGLSLFDNGLAFTLALVNPADAYELNGPAHQFFRIDLAQKTSAGKLPVLPDVYGSNGAVIRSYDNDQLLFAVSGRSENSIYSYQLANGAVNKKLSLTGGRCSGFDKLP